MRLMFGWVVIGIGLVLPAFAKSDRGVWESPRCQSFDDVNYRPWTKGLISGLNVFIGEKVRFNDADDGPPNLGQAAYFKKIRNWCEGFSPFVSLYPAALEAIRWHQDSRGILDREDELNSAKSALSQPGFYFPEADPKLAYDVPGCANLNNEAKSWIFGFVTGLNSGSLIDADLFAEHFSNPDELFNEIKEKCAAKSPQSALEVLMQYYRELTTEYFKTPANRESYKTKITGRQNNIESRLGKLAEQNKRAGLNIDSLSNQELFKQLDTPSSSHVARLADEISRRAHAIADGILQNPFDGDLLTRAASYRASVSTDRVLNSPYPYYTVDKFPDLDTALKNVLPDVITDEDLLKYALIIHPRVREVLHIFLEWHELSDRLLEDVNKLKQTSELETVTAVAREKIESLLKTTPKSLQTGRMERGFQLNFELPVKLKSSETSLHLTASGIGRSLNISENSGSSFGLVSLYSIENVPGFSTEITAPFKGLAPQLRLLSVTCWQPYDECALRFQSPVSYQPTVSPNQAPPSARDAKTVKQFPLEKGQDGMTIRIPFRFISYRNLDVSPEFSLKR